MLENSYTRLVQIHQKVEEIVIENKDLKENQAENQSRIDELQKIIELQKNALSALKEENKMIKFAKEMSTTNSDVHDLKIKINELVKDIDRCIDLLNE
ncbi:MAG: hypothetical protein CK532_02405 [Flavobacteriales bacterium]|nr:hypothetical protein [Flavobacteriaceae bacterium]PHX92693.1 MAG: hypothetical protein CK532_02405 [Flavobacteriales bacterium]